MIESTLYKSSVIADDCFGKNSASEGSRSVWYAATFSWWFEMIEKASCNSGVIVPSGKLDSFNSTSSPGFDSIPICPGATDPSRRSTLQRCGVREAIAMGNSPPWRDYSYLLRPRQLLRWTPAGPAFVKFGANKHQECGDSETHRQLPWRS